VLSALCKSGFPSQAIQFYIDKFDSHLRPDSYTYVEILDSLCRLGRVNDAIGFYCSILANNPESSVYVQQSSMVLLDRARALWR
jgi:pentatricopeptide repeat protein